MVSIVIIFVIIFIVFAVGLFLTFLRKIEWRRRQFIRPPAPALPAELVEELKKVSVELAKDKSPFGNYFGAYKNARGKFQIYPYFESGLQSNLRIEFFESLMHSEIYILWPDNSFELFSNKQPLQYNYNGNPINGLGDPIPANQLRALIDEFKALKI